MPVFECPTCGHMLTVARREDAPFRPFCSERCKMVDLGRWFDGTYTTSDPLTPQEIEKAATGQQPSQPPDSDELP